MKRIIILALAAALGALLWQGHSRAAPPPAPIGFIGDSITAQAPGGLTPATVAAALLGTSAINRAVSGTRTAQWLPTGRLLPGAIAAFRHAGVRVVHLMLGTNDARPAWRTAPAAYGAHLAAICGAIRGAGMVPIVSFSPYTRPDAADNDAAVDPHLLAYQPIIRRLAAGGICRLGDTRAYGAVAADPALLRDGIHPTPAGVRTLGRLWAAALRH